MAVFLPKQPFVLLEDSSGSEDAHSYIFRDIAHELHITSINQVESALVQLDAWRKDGYYCSGTMAYEAGFAFEERLDSLFKGGDAPLLHFGAFRKREILEGTDIEEFWRKPQTSLRPFQVGTIKSDLDFTPYEQAFQKAQNYINAGDIYQVNFTFPFTFEAAGDVLSLYRHIRRAQRVGFGALVVLGDTAHLSFSPELFIKRQGTRLLSRPMKGTAKRGRSWEEDEAAAQALHQDEKCRAENLMIVDLIRNDLSRVAQSGSVRVNNLFQVERYRTVLQMTSDVSCESSADFPTIMKALFPCGSITGAPKIRAMEIISELEEHRRGIYTGAIGHLEPNGDFSFSVPIRTIKLSKDGTGTLNVGSGLVADSQAQGEFEECAIKAQFLRQNAQDFDLFETMGWRPGEGIRYLNLHLARLQASAHYHGFTYKEADLLADLKHLSHTGPLRIKLMLSRQGAVSVLATSFPPQPQDITLSFAEQRVDKNNPMVFHKSTQRRFYEQCLENAPSFEVLLSNQDGEVTEGCFTNLFIQKGGQLFTPALDCGLLPGVLRHHLLNKGEVREARLKRHDVEKADAIFIGNALRGLMRAQLV